MEIRVYPYLGEHNIAIEGSRELLDRIEGNIEESAKSGLQYDGIVRIQEGEMREIVRDKNVPYISLKENNEEGIEGCDYIRYRTHAKTIWKKSPFEYKVKNHIPKDETGALKSFKRIYYALSGSNNKSLIHGATVDLQDKGILIVGKKKSGKTTLAFNMIDKMKASLVEGGSTLISSNEGLYAYYLPRSIFARFSTIVESPYLSSLIEDIEKTESTQPWDIEGIKEVIKAKSFYIDGGLTFSRRTFKELSKKNTLPRSKINTIIFPSYSNGGKVELRNISIDEAYKRILEREFEINTSLTNMQDQENIENPKDSKIKQDWIGGLNLKSISFDGNKDISKSLLEDLLS